MNNYQLKYHKFYVDRIVKLKTIVENLNKTLTYEEWRIHPTVKLVKRILQSTLEIIPADPNHRDYLLKGPLAKYRRYKQGLQRYRLLFCFSNTPKIVVYLYINDENHLRKDGDKNDPYQEFIKLVKKGYYSHNPQDVKMLEHLMETI